MTGTDWDESLKLDLVRLKSELSSHNIQVLSSGLGFGQYHTRERAADAGLQGQLPTAAYQDARSPGRVETIKHSATEKKRTSDGSMLKSAGQQMAQDLAGSLAAYPLEKDTKIQKNHVFYKFVKCFFIDIVFVIGTLVVVLCGIGLFYDSRHLVWNWQELQYWLPIRYLLDFPVWMVAAGFLGVFLVYRLFFKFVAGYTLGESLIGHDSEQA